MWECTFGLRSRCTIAPTIRNVVLHPSLRIDLQLPWVHWSTETGIELPGVLTIRVA
jgi:hypothetical protein